MVGDLVGGPSQQHEIFRRRAGSSGSNTRIAGRPSTNPGTRCQSPRLRIVAEVSGNLGLAVQARPVDEIEPHIVRNHGADGVEIPRIEVRDIGAKAIAIGLRNCWKRRIVRFVSQFAQQAASAMQGCLHRGKAEIHHLANFPSANSRAHPSGSRWRAGHRKAHEGAKAGAGDLAVQTESAGSAIMSTPRPMHRLLPATAAQEIQRGVVRDPE